MIYPIYHIIDYTYYTIIYLLKESIEGKIK